MRKEQAENGRDGAGIGREDIGQVDINELNTNKTGK